MLRPTLFFPVWTVFLAGYHANMCFDPGKTGKLLDGGSAGGSNPVFVTILLSMLMGAVYILNQITDIETDRKNNKLFFIANDIISKRNALIEGIALIILSIGFAFLLDYKLGLIFICIFFITGIIYNYEPFCWKDKPLLGIVANFGGGWAVASCGWIAGGTNNWLFAVYAIPYALGLVAVYLLTTLPDIPGDKEANKITFGVKYGQKASTYWAILFELITVIFSYLLKDYMLFLPALCSFPLFLIAAISQDIEDSLKAIKYTVLFASLAVCIKYPLYFFIILFTFYFSKWYYKKRFNLEYPKFAA